MFRLFFRPIVRAEIKSSKRVLIKRSREGAFFRFCLRVDFTKLNCVRCLRDRSTGQVILVIASGRCLKKTIELRSRDQRRRIYRFIFCKIISFLYRALYSSK